MCVYISDSFKVHLAGWTSVRLAVCLRDVLLLFGFTFIGIYCHPNVTAAENHLTHTHYQTITDTFKNMLRLYGRFTLAPRTYNYRKQDVQRKGSVSTSTHSAIESRFFV